MNFIYDAGLKDNSAGMTKAFTCALNENFPLNFTFVDFTNHPALKRFDFERLLSEVGTKHDMLTPTKSRINLIVRFSTFNYMKEGCHEEAYKKENAVGSCEYCEQG